MVDSPSRDPVRSDNVSRSSGSDEDVAIVQDPDTYFYNLQEKHHDSQWVRGLSPEDEDTTTNHESAELFDTSRNTQKASFDSDFAVEEMFKYPIVLGVISILNIMAQCVTNMDRYLTMDFPATEEVLWPHGWQIDESLLSFSHRILVPLLLSVVPPASFCVWLSFTIGRVTYDFTALCGVGTALLSFLGLLMQSIMLIRACGDSVRDFEGCEIPFVMYWVCSVARRWCPLMSLWCVTPALDRVSCRRRWKYLMAIPLLAFMLAVLASVHKGARASSLFAVAYGLHILIWSFFLIYLRGHRCIGGKCGKSHTD
ncbi:unnamed protein product [Phytomonas sp. EM1]|nr:unnamed protein product [Phytomonas sp. EM1]|eukprot:CCW62437.1 unnamed protein product [Phytomonas sp. isolate EM1]